MLFLLSGFSWTDDDLSAIFPVSTLLFKLFWNNRNPFEARWEKPHVMKTQ